MRGAPSTPRDTRATSPILSIFDERGSAFRRKGAYTQAIQDYDQAILLRPMDAVRWNNRCFTRAIVGRLEEALADCNESLRLRPDSPPTLDSRGLTYLKLGQPDRAIADYDAALRLLPAAPIPSMDAASRSGRRAISRAPTPTSQPRA